MVVDSTVFIDYLRGNKKAKDFLFQNKNLITSVVVVMEIIVGFSKSKDMDDFLDLLEYLDIEIIHISSTISYKALELFKHYHHDGLGIADSFIAATAFAEKQAVATHNTKHFYPIMHFDAVNPY
ncbi:PIN domain-containing protein [Candidatus Gottesmanbacteria bacterium]|nr:PIN domain-containing protein [Candidatus Gottesmanbacteria bacterium]